MAAADLATAMRTRLNFRTIRIALASVGLLAVLVLPSVTRAAEPGVATDLTWGISDADKQRSAAALTDLGSQWARLDIQWKNVETKNDTYNTNLLADYDKAVDAARAAGQRVLMMVYDAPSWASGGGSVNVPKSPADYASFMAYLANRWKGKVDAYEVWNEENIQRFWSPGPNAASYTGLLQAAYPAIKAADPTAKVIFGGTSLNDYSFVQAAYDAGAKGYFDAMATHPYTACGTSDPADSHSAGGGHMTPDSFLAYRDIHQVMVANGDAKPIWFTEFGWNTSTGACDPGAGQWLGGNSEAAQADYLYSAMKLIESDSYVQVAIYYNLRNNYFMHDSNEPEAQFGLMTSNYTHKRSYDALKAYTHATGWTRTTPPAPSSSGNDTPAEQSTAVPVSTTTTLKVLGANVAQGSVSSLPRGKVKLVVQQRRGHSWKRVRSTSAKVNSGGFRRSLRSLPAGQLRVYARFAGNARYRASRSRFVILRTH